MELKDEERMATIPVIVHQLDMARMWKVVKALIAIIIILLAIIGIGVYELTSCDFADVSVDSQDGGVSNYLNAETNGVINNVKDNSPRKDAQD